MRRPSLTAEEIRDELNQAALRFSLDGEGSKIDFMLPTPAEPESVSSPNWDVQAECPEGLDEIAGLRARGSEHVIKWRSEETYHPDDDEVALCDRACCGPHVAASVCVSWCVFFAASCCELLGTRMGCRRLLVVEGRKRAQSAGV